MIITSIPRSGSTKFCFDLAHELGYDFYDEIFEIGVPGNHKKIGLHQLRLKEEYPKTAEFIDTIDFDKSVINNHEINYFILEKTDVFISRKNIQDSLWSLVSHTRETTIHYHPYLNEVQLRTAMGQALFRWLDRVVFFYEYVHVKNKQIIIPQLEYTDTNVFREKFSEFRHMIQSIESKIILPPGTNFN